MSGARRVINGSINGTGSALEVRTIGFRPTRVELSNIDGLVTAKWNEAMPDGSMEKRVTAGTMTFPTSNGITPLSDGFRLGADTDMNVDGETVVWSAWD